MKLGNDEDLAAFGELLAIQLDGRDRAEFGALVAEIEERGKPYVRQQVERWLKGEELGTPARVFAIEKACGVVPGSMSKVLGFVPTEASPPLTLYGLVHGSPDLDEPAREIVLAALLAAIEQASARHRRDDRERHP